MIISDPEGKFFTYHGGRVFIQTASFRLEFERDWPWVFHRKERSPKRAKSAESQS